MKTSSKAPLDSKKEIALNDALYLRYEELADFLKTYDFIIFNEAEADLLYLKALKLTQAYEDILDFWI